MSRPASGHRETQRDIPDPLQRGGWISLIGTLAPPAVTLSAASFLVCLIVFGFLQRNIELRAIFSLQALFGEAAVEYPSGCRLAVLAATLTTAVLAWIIVLRCRRRPGPATPRLWALFLAVLTSVWAGLQYHSPWPNNAPWLDAATVAGFAATLTLLPRLLRFHPDSAWLQRIAPLSLLLVLLAILPAMYYLGGDMVQVRKRGLDGVISGLQQKTDDLRRCADSRQACAGYVAGAEQLANIVDTPFWHQLANTLGQQDILAQAEYALFDSLATGFADRWLDKLCGSARDWPDYIPNQAQQRVAQLAEIHFDTFKTLLPVAEKLGKLETLRSAYKKLLDAVVNALPQDSLSAPNKPSFCGLEKAYRAPSLKMQTVVYIPKNDGPWQPQPHFAESSQALVGYYQQINRLFTELGTLPDIQSPAAHILQADYQAHKTDWDQRFENMKKSWAYQWLSGFIGRQTQRGQISIAQNQPTPIEISLTESQIPVLEASLQEIVDMPVIGAMKLSDIEAFFDATGQALEKFANDGQLSNCEYKKSEPVDDLVSLVRCRAYAPGKTPAETRLKLELRLVYRTGDWAGKPRQIVLIIPAPPGQAMRNFIPEVQSAIPKTRQALQQLLLASEVQGISLRDTGGQSSTDGNYLVHAAVHLFSDAPNTAQEYLMIGIIKYQ